MWPRRGLWFSLHHSRYSCDRQARSPHKSDVASSGGLPSVVAPPGEPASSSGKVWSGDGMLRSSPVSMGDSEPVIMSEFSSDTDPDMEDELCRFQPLQAPVSPLSTTTSVGVMASPSCYPAPTISVGPAAVSSTRVLHELVREVYSSGALDVFPVYEPSPDTSLYVPVTSPVTPALSEGPVQLLGTESLPPGGPASMDSLLAYDITLLDRDQVAAAGPVAPFAG